jgi:hypothetical protein
MAQFCWRKSDPETATIFRKKQLTSHAPAFRRVQTPAALRMEVL